MNEIENCVYIRETCPECLGTCKANYGWPVDETCHKCNGKSYISYWQPVSEFAATIAHLVEVKVQPYTTNT